LSSMWHTFFGHASFLFFFIAHTINNMERVIVKQSRNFYFMDGWWIMLIPSVGISHMNMGVYVILITKYEKILARVTQFDKTQWSNKHHMDKVLQHYSYGAGRYFASLKNLPFLFYFLLQN
jgi:hypothetical protein